MQQGPQYEYEDFLYLEKKGDLLETGQITVPCISTFPHVDRHLSVAS